LNGSIVGTTGGGFSITTKRLGTDFLTPATRIPHTFAALGTLIAIIARQTICRRNQTRPRLGITNPERTGVAIITIHVRSLTTSSYACILRSTGIPVIAGISIGSIPLDAGTGHRITAGQVTGSILGYITKHRGCARTFSQSQIAIRNAIAEIAIIHTIRVRLT